MKPTYSIDYADDGSIARMTVNIGPTRVKIEADELGITVDVNTSDRYLLLVHPLSANAVRVAAAPEPPTPIPGPKS